MSQVEQESPPMNVTSPDAVLQQQQQPPQPEPQSQMTNEVQQPQDQQQQQDPNPSDANDSGVIIGQSELLQQQIQQASPANMGQQQQHGLNVANEIKRLQQIQHMNAAGSPGNALIMQGGQRQVDASVIQSMLDQKVQNTRFENPLAQSMGAGTMNPMLQPAFFQDPRFFMATAQSQFSPNRQNEVPLPSPHSLFHRDGTRRMRGGVIEPFPEKLHRLLMEVEAAGRADVISFVASGRAFSIHKPDKFFKEIVPLYFRQSRLSSFKRQLNLYGFELINTGPARGGYYHELFVKDRPELCRRMRRVAVKVSSKAGGADHPSTPPAEETKEGSEEKPAAAESTEPTAEQP